MKLKGFLRNSLFALAWFVTISAINAERFEFGSVPKDLIRAVNSEDEDKIRNIVKELYGDSIPDSSEVALYASSLKVLILLSELGAKIDVSDRDGMNLLMIASQGGYIEIVEYLIKKKFDVNQKDFFGRTPLYYSCGNVTSDVAEILLKNGAYINVQNSEGVTPLMFAVEEGGLEVVRVILKYDPILKLHNCKNETIFEYLMMKKRPHVDEDKWELIKDSIKAHDDKKKMRQP